MHNEREPIVRKRRVGPGYLIAIGLTAALLMGCAGSDSSDPTVTATASPLASATNGPTPTPEVPDLPFYDKDTVTGVTAVDSAIMSMVGGDKARFLALIHYLPVACSNGSDSVLPECVGGAAEGTPTESVLSATCERNWLSKSLVADHSAEIADHYLSQQLGVYAVAQLAPPDRTVNEGGDPPAKYLIVFGPVPPVSFSPMPTVGEGDARFVMVDEQGIVRMATGCRSDPSKVVSAADVVTRAEAAGSVTGFLLPPLDR